jgi:hypothetical protein
VSQQRLPDSSRSPRVATDTLETVSAIATTGCSSALGDISGLLKWLSVQAAVMSAFPTEAVVGRQVLMAIESRFLTLVRRSDFHTADLFS